MIDSILESIKKLLGISNDFDSFDNDIIMHINTVFSNLHQIGVIETSFSIEGNTEKWSDVFDDAYDLNQMKTYIYLKVRLFFDPPSNSSLVQSINEQIKELEWRMYVEKKQY